MLLLRPVTFFECFLRLATVQLQVTTGLCLEIYQKINTQGVAKCQIPVLNANIAPLKTHIPPDELYLKRVLSIGCIDDPIIVFKFFILTQTLNWTYIASMPNFG